MVEQLYIKPRTTQEMDSIYHSLNEIGNETGLTGLAVKSIIEHIIADVAIHEISYSATENLTFGVHPADVTVTKTGDNTVMVEIDF